MQVRGEVRIALKLLDLAAQDLNKSETILAELIKQSPTDTGILGPLGTNYGARGRLALARKDAKTAAMWFDKAVDSLRRAHEKDKENATIRASLEEFKTEARMVARAKPGSGPIRDQRD